MYIAKLLLLLLSPIIGATCALLLLLPHSECTLTRFNYWIIAIIPAGSKLIKRKRLWNLLGKWEIENWFALCCCCCRWCQFHSFQLSKTSLVSQRSSAQLCFSLKEDACCWRCASCQNVDGGRPFSLLLNSASAAFDISRLCTHRATHTLRQRRRRRRRRLRRRRRRLKASSSSSSSSLLESIDRGLWRYTKKLKNDVRRCRCRRHIEFSKLLSLLSLWISENFSDLSSCSASPFFSLLSLGDFLILLLLPTTGDHRASS